MENRRLAIVGDQQSGRSTKELQGSNVRANPAAETLIQSRFGKGVTAGAENGNEDGGLRNGACF